MLKHYISSQEGLSEIETMQKGCWEALTKPTEEELVAVATNYQIDIDLLRAALDKDERSRIDNDTGYTMILVNIPTIDENSETELYCTIPFSIIVVEDAVITVCSEHTPIIDTFINGKVKNYHTQMKSRFVLQLLYQVDALYLQHLRSIDRRSDEVETKLHKSTQNRELIELLKLEKSLVYFTTALRSNETVLEKLVRTDLIKKYSDDAELLDDVIVENKQAIEMTNIYSGILSGMMDAFASVISNNLNIVMKVLAIVTIVMSIPTMIFSAYGMNVNSGGMLFADSPWGFSIIIGITAIIVIIMAIIFTKLKLFK
ncbi:MAG: magnesium transporter CorA family protein [Bacilli bacterium]|nr:magnesium transporter CorA family protein [Bacilli bacterium]MDD3099070.1 magnesium transporter CorA family protein [Bacilli bacterium]